jgi:hypothetical protein
MKAPGAFVAAAALSFSAVAWAQRGAEPASQRVTVMDLEGDLIEGTGDRPDLESIDAAPHAQHESLIRVRQDFRAEAMESVSAL